MILNHFFLFNKKGAKNLKKKKFHENYKIKLQLTDKTFEYVKASKIFRNNRELQFLLQQKQTNKQTDLKTKTTIKWIDNINIQFCEWSTCRRQA